MRNSLYVRRRSICVDRFCSDKLDSPIHECRVETSPDKRSRANNFHWCGAYFRKEEDTFVIPGCVPSAGYLSLARAIRSNFELKCHLYYILIGLHRSIKIVFKCQETSRGE